MFSKTIEYEDFNGNKQSKTFYFHISKAELIEMAGGANDLQARIERMMRTNDAKGILGEYKELLKLAVGVRSDDGQRFDKSEAAQAAMFESPAYDELLMELATDAEKSAEFINNLLPEKLRKEMVAQLEKQKGDSPDPFKDPAQFSDPKDNRPAWLKMRRIPVSEDMRGAKPELIALAMELFQRDAQGLRTAGVFDKMDALYK